MIILSFLTFTFMLVWMLASVLAVVLGFCCADGNAGSPMWAFLGGIFSLVCWYQVIVWGEPWFRVLAQAWM